MLAGRQGLFALRMVLFLSLLAHASYCYASVPPLNSKSKALAHYIMAVCHDLNGEDAQAVSEYQKSIKFDAFQAAPRLKLGVYYLRLEQINQAVAQLEAAVRISPEDLQAHYWLALIYSSQHKYDLAASEYKNIIKEASDSTNTDAYMYLGQLYYAQKKYPQAIEQFLKVTHITPSNTSAIFLLGSVWVDSNDTTKAIEAFRHVLQIEPEHSEALNALGYTYAEQGLHLDEAITMIRKAIEIDPSNGAYYDSLGWALYKNGKYTESLGVLQKAATLIENEILYDHMGDVYKALKQYTQAIIYWRKSLDLVPNQILVQKKIKELEKCMASQSLHQLN